MSKHDFCDLILKGITAIGFLIGGTIGLWKHLDTSKRELRRPFLERQLELYFDATCAAATLATASDEQTWKEARNKFWQLYYGPLALVQNESVAYVMRDFNKTLKSCDKAFDCGLELQEKATKLAARCRESVGESWKIQLASLYSDADGYIITDFLTRPTPDQHTAKS